jgi:hypothetical protein
VERAGELTDQLLESEWLGNLARIVAALDLPDCWIGAGAVRDLGLDDLLDGVWRRNPGRSERNRVTDAEYRARLDRKQPHERRPGVVVIRSS